MRAWDERRNTDSLEKAASGLRGAVPAPRSGKRSWCGSSQADLPRMSREEAVAWPEEPESGPPALGLRPSLPGGPGGLTALPR